jgi:cytochrome c oxidase assembly protein subunit 15
MAGLRAGLVSDTWPGMTGAFSTFFPGASQSGESLGHMLTDDPAIVHFIHRWWAWVVVAALVVLARDRRALPARLTGLGLAAGVILFVQLFYGALMAGLRAGLVSDTWPGMTGTFSTFFPGASQSGESLGHLLTDDPAIVHFIHRWWAWVVVVALVWLARAVRKSDRPASVAIHSAFGIQILLGIATVMTQVNIALAAFHQLVGALLLVSVVWGAHAIGRRRA